MTTLRTWMCLATVVLIVGDAPLPAQDQLELFTEEDANQLRIEGDAWDPVPRARSATLGPHIVVESPQIKRMEGSETIETTSPTSMMVLFHENQAPVDMRSLEIHAKKGPFQKSLTQMLIPYVDGTTLAVENVEVPSGKYQIRITVEDEEGHETTRTYRLVVAE